MHPYVVEEFTSAEAEVLRRYFTSLDGPVFALVNLPEVVKGALFARYSRSAKSLRRLFLDEFVGDLDLAGDAGVDATVGLERAAELYQRIFYEYGDDSVAQLGGVHLACEQASNVLTKVLERGRLMSYLEQSTRYLGYDRRLPNGLYRYYRDPAVLESRLGARYVGEMDRMFDTYAEVLGALTEWLTERFPKTADDTDFVYRQAIRAKALDASRGLLPASAISNVGIYGSGQGYESLLLRMRAHPLPEVRSYAQLMLDELMKVIPSFLRRVEVAERGGAWSDYLARTRGATRDLVRSTWRDVDDAEPGESVRLVDYDPEGERRVCEAIVFEASAMGDAEVVRRVGALNELERTHLIKTYVGARLNRRHRPGRAFERTDYRFELVTDYGAFRDLQRHRLLTVEWQPLTPALGFDVPDVVADAGLAERFAESLGRSADLYADLAGEFPEQSQYAVALAFRIRYSLQLNAREAMHLIELRSGPQGHPSYRRVAQEMARLIRDVAGHRAIAEAMGFVDLSDTDLERLESERAAERARRART
ncbi:MAG TPA: FAD-dependent thymidylate synthase [Acidimicrobiales bacterium]|nr:FAD-dependent thymidylate synthase [Acidimicrobiales bacterium]